MTRREIETDEFNDCNLLPDVLVKFVNNNTSILWLGGSNFVVEKKTPGLGLSRQPATPDQIEDMVKTTFIEQPKSEEALRMAQGAAIRFKEIADELDNKSRQIMTQLEKKGCLKIN